MIDARTEQAASRPTAVVRSGTPSMTSVGLALLTTLCFWLDFRVISAAFAYLIFIVLLSLSGGFPSLIALSFVSVGCLSFFFAPPIFSFRIDYPEDIIAVTGFLITSLTIAGLVARMRTGRDELSDLLDAADYTKFADEGGH